MTKTPATVIGIVLWAGCATPGRAQPNPYCVTGVDWRANGRMVKLGMPGGLTDWSGSLGYRWGAFDEWNIPSMTNPSYRWTTFGNTPPRHSYDVDTESILDPTWTSTWVQTHPGKVYIIGNEPDNPQLDAGDGMTPVQYARMYHVYHEFIKAIDPTARLAVAGLVATADTASVNGDIAWWNQVLDYYRTTFGEEMPIDIWNCHFYTPVGLLDPDRIIADYVVPFRHYVDTVSGGIYAGREIWCTEFGVAMWSTPLDPGYMAEFAQQLCPRLEANGAISRFFWFLGPYEATWRDSALLSAQNVPTVIGVAYSALANGYPNPIPAPPADPPPPVPEVSSDFESTASPWRVMAGDWSLDGGAYRQTRMTGAWGLRAHLPYWYHNFRMSFDVRINAANSDANWAGANFRGGTIWRGNRTRSYLVFLRQNGELGFHTKDDGTVVSVPGVVADTSTYHRIDILARDWHFEVAVDGVTQIVWDDPNHRYAYGFASIEAGMTDCSFDNVVVQAYRPGDFNADNDADLEDFSFFQVCFNGPGRPPAFSSCDAADLDMDGDVDVSDFGVFLTCYNGAGRPPACGL